MPEFDTGKPMPVLETKAVKEKIWERFGFKSAAEWIYRNTIASKTFLGVSLIVVSPLTGVMAPGVAAAGKILVLVGVGDKAMKNKAEIGAVIGGLIAGMLKKNKKKEN